MIRTNLNPSVSRSLPYFASSSSQLSRLPYSSLLTPSNTISAHKTHFDKECDEKARKLIFSERNYLDFTPEEKRIVDLYQEKMFEVDGRVILPNTKADLEHQEIAQLLAERKSQNE